MRRVVRVRSGIGIRGVRGGQLREGGLSSFAWGVWEDATDERDLEAFCLDLGAILSLSQCKNSCNTGLSL